MMIRNENHNLTITRDPIFGHVFSKSENCLHLLQSILPDLGITEVEVTPQKQPGVRFRYYQSVADQDSLKPGEDLDQIR